VIRVAVVAPALAVRAGLRALLSADQMIEVVTEAHTLTGALAAEAEIDLLVVASEPLLLTEAVEALQASGSMPVLLLVSGEAEAGQVAAILQPRAWGLLPLDSSADELVAAVHALYEGLIVGAPVFWQRWIDAAPQALHAEAKAFGNTLDQVEPETLTERETQVLQLLAQGLANKQIAAQLGISEHTVKFHVSSIYGKLGATNRTEAVRLGARRGLVIL
jgi:DNA-binding NarL/FixJ family response regulator